MSARLGTLLAALAAYELPGSSLALPRHPLDPPSWDGFLRRVEAARLQGLLAVAMADGAWPATTEQIEQARLLHLQAMGRVLSADRCVLSVTGILEREGIRYRVLKGTALAHIAYPDPAQRVYGDADLLVGEDDFDRAGSTLVAAGFRRSWPALRRGFDRRFTKAVTYHAPDGNVVDLHRTLAVGPFGMTVELAELFDGAEPFELGGRRLEALTPEHQLLHASYSAALAHGAPRLVTLRDVAQLLLSRPIRTFDLLDAAAGWQAQVLLARAVGTAWDRLQLTGSLPLTTWAAGYIPSDRERLALACYLDGRGYGAKALASLRVIPGAGAKVAFAGAVLFPRREFLASRQTGRLRWLSRGAAGLLAKDRP